MYAGAVAQCINEFVTGEVYNDSNNCKTWKWCILWRKEYLFFWNTSDWMRAQQQQEGPFRANLMSGTVHIPKGQGYGLTTVFVRYESLRFFLVEPLQGWATPKTFYHDCIPGADRLWWMLIWFNKDIGECLR